MSFRNLGPFIAICLLPGCQNPKSTDQAIPVDGRASGYAIEKADSVHMNFLSRKDTTEEPGDLEKSLQAAGLVNIQEVIPDALVELKYSTTDNFFGKDVYGELTNAYLQPEVADMLKKAYGLLQEKYPELTLLIYDGVRPRSVQQILWDNLDKPDSIKPLYVADPKKGGLHNYGVAVDLTLAEKSTGKPLDMGTAYDFFGYPAYPDREDQMLREGKITQAHINNRKKLREVMNGAGFTGIGSEWWHFDAFSRKEASQKFAIVE
jgi:zinc D-Ala-D-Ala dipeptidase